MSDKGIIFSAPMVKALLAGRKTQTRRLLTLRGHRKFSEFGPSDTAGYDWHFRRADGCWCDHRAEDLPLPYAVGDRLYVREAWSHTGCGVWTIDDARRQISGKPIYRATDQADAGIRWWPSIHMPREFSRLWLEVTSVRVERLQSISAADAITEGLVWTVPGKWSVDHSLPIVGDDPCIVYSELWNGLHSKPGETWRYNPWVVAISFAVHHGNIGQ